MHLPEVHRALRCERAGGELREGENDMSEPMPVRLLVGGRLLTPVLPADSFNSIVVRS